MFDILKAKKQRMTAEKNLKIYMAMTDVADVASGYGYWKRVLVNKIIRMFEYENLDDTIPQTELEKLVLLPGYCAIVSTEYGEIAVPASTYGIGLYESPAYKPFTIWATPLVKGHGLTNKDAIIIRNNSFCTGVLDTVNRYARMLADIESSLAITLVNIRQPSMAAAPDESTAYSYVAARLALTLGSPEAIINKSVYDDIKNLDAIKTIPPSLLSDVIDARDNLLSQFMSEFGVATRQSKKAPMTTDEVESDHQLHTVNITDMLMSREESLDIYNYVRRKNVSVHLNEAYKPIEGSKPATFNNTDNPTTGQAVNE